MSDRVNDPADRHNQQDDVYGDANVYGDTSADLPVVEEATYGDSTLAETTKYEENAHSEAEAEAHEAATEVASEPIAPESRETHIEIVENEIAAAQEETSAAEKKPVDPVHSESKAEETTPAAVAEPKENPVELPEVETTMVTRRSLLGGAPSTIPSAPASTFANESYEADEKPAETKTFTSPTETAPVTGQVEETAVAPVVSPTPSRTNTLNEPTQAEIFAGATVPIELPGRVGAHIATFFLGVFGVPLAWYLTVGGMAEIGTPAQTPTWAGIISLCAGLAIAVFIILTNRWSTLGQIIGSILLLGASAPYYVRIPQVQNILDQVLAYLRTLGSFGERLATTTTWSINTGVMTVAGILGLFIAIGAHGARKNGRRREELRQSIERHK
ncbi:hypothetical protein KRX54_01160 [Actinomycetaceae bacterium TAE3-ERU4]|nr:hypothetical protein [Actinomycetaceae bacterium TAE3-ERU4]